MTAMEDNLIIMPIAARDTLALRHALLRPHLTPETCVYPGDDADTTNHLGAFMGDAHCGIVSLYRETQHEFDPDVGYRFRALAITPELRGRGYGGMMLETVEELAREQGAEYLWANARMTAIDFYVKAGFEVGDVENMVEGVGPHRIVVRDFRD